MQNLAGKVAVITGGSSGIGLGIARQLATEGMKLVIVGMDGAKAQRIADEFKANGTEAIGLHCDVSKRAEIEAMADIAYETFGTVDLLVNNAGVGYGGSVDQLAENNWDWVIDVNLKSIYLCSGVFVARFLERGDKAHIVNMGSEQCFGLADPQFGSMSAYVTSKHGVLGLSEMMRRDFADAGIVVSVVCPGPVATEIWNAERARPPEYGQKNEVDPDRGAAIADVGMDPDLVGKITVAGIKDDDFYIITHDYIRDMIENRYREAIAAMDKTDKWLAEYS